jgi:hypothetical protein
MYEAKFQELVLDQFKKMNSHFDSLENQIKENTQILKALEHVAEVNKAEHDRMFGYIRNIKGNVEAIVDERIENYLDRKTFKLIAVNE